MNKIVEIINPSFAKSPEEPMTLVNFVGEKEYGFAAGNSAAKTFAKWISYSADKREDLPGLMSEIIGQYALDKTQWKEIINVYRTEDVLAVPSSFYNENLVNVSFNLVQGDLVNGINFHDHLPGWGLSIQYRVSSATIEILRKIFPSAYNWSYVAGVLKYLGKKITEPSGRKPLLLTDFHSQRMLVITCEKKDLKLVNYFAYHTPEDVLYHLLNICERFGYDKEAVQFQFSGMIEKDSPLYTALYAYLPEIVLLPFTDGWTCNEHIGTLPQHFFSPLQFAAECV